MAERGGMGRSGQARTPSCSQPEGEVRDTNGAGDVFHAAFTLALAEGQPEAYAVQFAHAAAALKCMVVGGRLGAPASRQRSS